MKKVKEKSKQETEKRRTLLDFRFLRRRPYTYNQSTGVIKFDKKLK